MATTKWICSLLLAAGLFGGLASPAMARDFDRDEHRGWFMHRNLDRDRDFNHFRGFGYVHPYYRTFPRYYSYYPRYYSTPGYYYQPPLYGYVQPYGGYGYNYNPYGYYGYYGNNPYNNRGFDLWLGW